MAMKVEASRLLIHRAAHNAAEGLPSIFESSVGKCFSNEMAREVTGTAIPVSYTHLTLPTTPYV